MIVYLVLGLDKPHLLLEHPRNRLFLGGLHLIVNQVLGLDLVGRLGLPDVSIVLEVFDSIRRDVDLVVDDPRGLAIVNWVHESPRVGIEIYMHIYRQQLTPIYLKLVQSISYSYY